MFNKKFVFPMLALFTAAGLSGCSSSGPGTGSEHFRTLAQESVDQAEYLPGDFPIPVGAGITFTDGELVGGKKSSMLIFETEESMDALGSTYKEYVKAKELDRGTQIVDSNNLIINGKVQGDYSYSIIGSSLDTKPGGAEVIVTWIEN
ncbi:MULTISPECIES: hypothetical protein [Paenibacillus]|uniref:Lipoprotein n=1 Tax=Paenibacillus borealis TaxID=160799 RepID=A0ABX3HDH5_PAEBO|nr:hypothetical protein [Paenibacillus borealis]OMD48039.1 hypothetical protein BSK56_12065 [Paenibacillus borealis]